MRCKREEKADLQRPDTRIGLPKSLFEKRRSHSCVSDFLKRLEVNPRPGGSYSCFILAFLGQHLGNFSRNSLGMAQAEVSTFSAHRRTSLDPVGDVNCCVFSFASICGPGDQCGSSCREGR